MKKILILATLLLTVLGAAAQIPRWTLHPVYSSVKALGNGYYVVSKNGKYGMMDKNEKDIVPLQYDSISPFRSGSALLFQNDEFVAYVNDKGVLTDVASHHYKVVGPTVFLDGYLLVYTPSGFYYIRARDHEVIGPFSSGTPFCEGYARVRVPKSQKHVLDGSSTYRYLSASTGELVPQPQGDFDEDDVDFNTSVSNGKSLIIIKKRVYEYDVKKGMLTPLATDNNPDNKKTRVYVPDRLVMPMKNGSIYTIMLKQGHLTTDELFRLTSIQYDGQELKRFPITEKTEPAPDSPLKGVKYEGTELFGLSYNGVEVLPAQFQKICFLQDHDAIVKLNGKYGVVTVDPNNSCRYMLNDGLDVGFDHKSIKTNVKVMCPPYMKPALMKLESHDPKCVIHTDSRKEVANVESAALVYQCTMNIPDDIEIERQPAQTSFSFLYDGLRYATSTIDYKTWYINNYSVELVKNHVSGNVMNAEVMVRYNGISDQKYFKKVEIDAGDSIVGTIDKVTEDLYTAKLTGWTEDRVKMNIDVTEDGCPTLSYPFILSTKGNNTETKQEKATQKPKAKAAASKPVRPAKSARSKDVLLIPN